MRSSDALIRRADTTIRRSVATGCCWASSSTQRSSRSRSMASIARSSTITDSASARSAVSSAMPAFVMACSTWPLMAARSSPSWCSSASKMSRMCSLSCRDGRCRARVRLASAGERSDALKVNGRRPLRMFTRGTGDRLVTEGARSGSRDGPAERLVRRRRRSSSARRTQHVCAEPNVTAWVGWVWFAAFAILTVGLVQHRRRLRRRALARTTSCRGRGDGTS